MNKIEKLAIDVRFKLGIPDDERLDVFDTLRRLRISGVISDFGPDSEVTTDGSAARWDHDTKAILFAEHIWNQPNFADDPEVRFTVFHEIGHAVLNHGTRNRKVGGRVQFGRYVEQDEQDADLFALAFAIPLTFARNASGYDVDKLSSEYGLPTKMSGNRLVDLQRHNRFSNSLSEGNDDNYAEAVAEMRKNALRWNSEATPRVATKDEDWDF